MRLGIKDITLHKMRSFLTMLGVVFGVGSVVAMLAVGEGASEQALAQIKKLGSNNIVIRSAKASAASQEGSQKNSYMSIYGLLYEDRMRIAESIPVVTRTVPVKILKKKAVLGERHMEVRIVGTTEEWARLVKRPLVAGRFMTKADVEGSAGICVITEFAARKILATKNSIGQSIRLGSQSFVIVGIVRNESAGSVQVPDQQSDVYIPITSCVQRYGEVVTQMTTGSRQMERVELNELLVEIDATEHVEPAARAIETMLKRFHKKEDYAISVPLTLLRQAEATKRTFNIVLGSIAGISLLVGGIGIMNIMLASVTERTMEIGIRRAIGAKRIHIVMQFLVETVVLSGAGGLLGIVFGVTVPKAITLFSGMPTSVPAYAIVLSFGISVSIGVVFGLYPAIRAANLDPIEALRHE